MELSQETLRAQSALYGALYSKLIAAVSAAVSARFGLPPRAAAVTAREALLPLVHFYLDRLLRLDLLIRSRPRGAWRVPRPARELPHPQSAVAFWGACHSSLDFNQALLCRLAPLLDLKVDGTLPAPAAPAASAASARAAVNRNFDGSTFLQRAGRKTLDLLDTALRRAGVGSRIPALSMAYHTEPLRNAGFYFMFLQSLRGRLAVERAPRDAALRRELLVEPLLKEAPAVAEFLRAAGFSRPEAADAVARDFAAFCAESYPDAYLEALPSNLERARALLRPFVPRPLLLAEANGDEGILFMTAAKSLGQEAIIVQHGGYSGYIDDHVGATEYEYPYADRFVGWGWDAMPDIPACRDIPVAPLPSPWLAERARYWARALPAARRLPAGKPHDFLFMTNRIYRFAQSPGGAYIMRSDRLREFCGLVSELAGEAAARDARILHKSYGAAAAKLMADTTGELSRKHPAHYRLLDTPDKGLSPDLLDQCAVVLWDSPGTGFLECLAAGIPTMLLWPRLYNREEPRRDGIFRALEAAGLVHRTPKTLLDELACFKSDATGWLNAPARRAAVDRFMGEFGRADADWPRQWRRFLEERRAAARRA